MKRPLELSDIKPLVVGHWGTTPGQNFIYVHLNRVIAAHDLDMIYIAGPGHGGLALVGNTYFEGSYSEIYPNVSQDELGMKRLFTQFSFPGGISSHVAPTTPGSIHEGGELGYSLSHAFGAAFDNPELIVACVIGDGEAETGPLATAWQSTKFLNPVAAHPRFELWLLTGSSFSPTGSSIRTRPSPCPSPARHGRTVRRAPEAVGTYYTTSQEYAPSHRAVYHTDNACPYGKEITASHRQSGTGGRTLCSYCAEHRDVEPATRPGQLRGDQKTVLTG